MTALEEAQTRLAIARAKEIELRTAREMRDLVSMAELEQIVSALAERFFLIVKTSRVARARAEQEFREELKTVRQRIQTWRGEA